MSFSIADWPDLPATLIAEVKSFVRIDHDADDAAIDGFLRSAAGLCEDFTGKTLIVRPATDVLRPWQAWQRLKRLPVQAILSVVTIEADGTETPLAVPGYAIDIDGEGLGWVRLTDDSEASRMRITYSCGLAADWDALPAGLRHGIVRLAGYLYANRDGVHAGGPPRAVTALWRPYRRMRMA